MRSRPLTAPAVARGVRGRRTGQLVAVPYLPGLTETIAVNSARLAWRVLATLVRHPVVSTVALVVGVAVHRWGVAPVFAVGLLLAAGLATWRHKRSASFSQLVGGPARAGFRRTWVYARLWQPAMVLSGLAGTLAGREWLPQLRRVRSTR